MESTQNHKRSIQMEWMVIYFCLQLVHSWCKQQKQENIARQKIEG